MPFSTWDMGGCCCGSNFTCGTCAIPAQNLTVTWTNIIIGNGSTTLFYNSTLGVWTSNCTNEVIYQLSCNNGQVEFRVFYFISGVCPTGQTNYCSNLPGGAGQFTQTALVCGSAFMLSVNVGSCGTLGADGYGTFTVTL